MCKTLLQLKGSKELKTFEPFKIISLQEKYPISSP
jgi:hypothetical protein